MASPFRYGSVSGSPGNLTRLLSCSGHEIIAQLHAVLGPRYYADVEVRTVLEEVGVAATKTVYPDTAVLETTAGNVLSATAVAIPAAPIQRLAMLPEEHKLRTVQVREMPPTAWSSPLKSLTGQQAWRWSPPVLRQTQKLLTD